MMDGAPPYGDFPWATIRSSCYAGRVGPGPMTDMPPPEIWVSGGPAIDPATGMAPQPPEGPGEGGYDDGPAPMDYPPKDQTKTWD